LDSYGVLSLLPFILGIFFILWQKDIIFPIIGSLIIGSIILSGFNPLLGFFNTASDIILRALLDPLNIIIIFLVVEIILIFNIFNHSGFIYSINKDCSGRWLTKNRFESLILISNVFLFIDRYFSVAIVGIFSKPIAEKKGLSFEKLAYLLNTVTSSISTIIPYTTLTALIVGTIGASFNNLGINYSPLKAFYKSIPFQFYNIFSIFLAITTVILKKDIFFMKNISLKNALKNDSMSFGLNSIRKKKTNALISSWGFFGSIIIVFGSLIGRFLIGYSGFYKIKILNIQYPQTIIVGALFSGIIFSILYAIITGSITYKQLKTNKFNISPSIFFAIIYIVLAMSMENLSKRLNFTPFFMNMLRENTNAGLFLPMIIFIFSTIISFLSGSYIFTITTLMPYALRLTTVNLTDPMILDNLIFAVIAAVLSGATFGDINSPFSLNFIISTASSNASITGHFITQIVYSLIAFFTSVVFGYLLFVLHLKVYLSISSGILFIAIIFFMLENDKLYKK